MNAQHEKVMAAMADNENIRDGLYRGVANALARQPGADEWRLGLSAKLKHVADSMRRDKEAVVWWIDTISEVSAALAAPKEAGDAEAFVALLDEFARASAITYFFNVTQRHPPGVEWMPMVRPIREKLIAWADRLAAPSKEAGDAKLADWLQRINDAGSRLAKHFGEGQPHMDMIATVTGLSALALERLAAPSKEAGPELTAIQQEVHRVLGEGDGYWTPCSGCHETNEGYETGAFPYSDTFRCYLGGGCTECGGLGAIWFEIPEVSELDLANPSGDQRQEGECELAILRAANGRLLNQLEQATATIIGLSAAVDAASPPPEAAAAVGELRALADAVMHESVEEETHGWQSLPAMRVCYFVSRLRTIAAALAAPTGPQPAGGGVVAWVSANDCMFRSQWKATTPILYSSHDAVPGLIPLYSAPRDVDAAMVERGCAAWNKEAGLAYATADRDCMRAALLAAIKGDSHEG
jgi:hypothetical protein